MVEAVLQLKDVNKSFGGLRATDDVSLNVMAGEAHALIGPNGAGKSTLIHQIAGNLTPDDGSIVLCGRDITRASSSERANMGLARTFQITSILPAFTALENVALGVQARSGSSFRFFRRASGERALVEPAMESLARVGMQDRAHVVASRLSHGERRALEIAMALAMNPRMLLLDEPMAGAGPADTERLVAVLQSLKGHIPMLLVEHDMNAVFALADRISVLIYGRILFTGSPAAVREDPRVIAAYLGDSME